MNVGKQLLMNTSIWHCLNNMDKQKLQIGLNYTITEHDIVSTITVSCSSTDKILENILNQVFNGIFEVRLNTML